MSDSHDETVMFQVDTDQSTAVAVVISTVYQALKEKGYNPINQIVGYLLSGDPTYITNHMNARNLIRKIERDELLEELVQKYVVDK